jgi:diguanylate cyclase (GGDEF)-like protein
LKLHTTQRIILRIGIIIAFSEFLIMLALNMFPVKLNTLAEAVVDVILLATLSTPSIYLWVIKPFVIARDEALFQVSNLALTDSLTKLSNRRYLLNQLQSVISSCKRNKVYGSLLLVDLDGFKDVNDLCGHDAGDAVLIEIANRFRAAIRTEDFVCRLGGDEFVVMFNHFGADEQRARENSQLIADKLISLASSPIEYKQHTFQIGASIGIKLIRHENMDADSVIREADVAMYRSKKSGKGRATFSD